MSRVHDLDHASTSPLRPEARDAMVAALAQTWGDPSRLHGPGQRARHALEQARSEIAEALGARPRELVLTSGATESIVAACRGVGPGHQVFAAVEHSAVRTAARAAGDVTEIGVDGHGRVDPDEVMAAIRPDTRLVHVQWGNHEVGTLQPVAEIVAGCRQRDVRVHVDAAQAVGQVTVHLRDTGADLVSISGHKLGGPLGTGILFTRRGVRLTPLLVGGDQELDRRAGTENTPSIVGLAAAVAAATATVAAEGDRRRALTERIRSVLAATEGVRLHGHPSLRLPHITSASISDVEPQAVLLGLDRHRIAAHSGSACASADLEPSPVLAAMGVDAHHSLRLSVGWSSTDADVDAFADAFGDVLAGLRALRR